MDSGKKILMFEDDYERMKPVKEYLEEKYGCAIVLTAEKNILERLKTESFDLLLVDRMIHTQGLDENGEEVENVHFSGINWRETGIEFLKRLRAGEFYLPGGTSPDVPAMVVSAVADTPTEKEIGVSIYFEKPFRLEDLSNQVAKLLGG